MWLMQNAMAKPDNAGAGSTDYMHLFGLVALGYMWARMAKVGAGQDRGRRRQPYLDAKLVTGRFFMERMLPETAAHLARIQTGARRRWRCRRKRSDADDLSITSERSRNRESATSRDTRPD